MEAVRIGLIGAGVIGAAHSVVLREIAGALGPRLRLVAVADPLPERRALFASTYGYEQTFADGAELLAHAPVDALFICTPTRFHAEYVHAAAQRGRHVFCEKPLAMDYAEGTAMVAAVERAGITAQIGLVLRYSAVYNVIRDIVSADGAGPPLAVLFRDDQCFPIRGVHASAWRADAELTAGGTLIEHGVHDLDLLTWLFGPVAELRAWEQNRAGHPGIEDYMAVELQFASGVRAQLINLWHDMVQRPSNRRLEIFCNRLFVATDHDMSGSIILQRNDDGEERLGETDVLRRFRVQRPDLPARLHDWCGVAYLVQDYAFIASLLADRPATPGIRAGLEAQRLAAAVYHAARSGHAVDVQTFTGDALNAAAERLCHA